MKINIFNFLLTSNPRKVFITILGNINFNVIVLLFFVLIHLRFSLN
jgi:hypothetical protein